MSDEAARARIERVRRLQSVRLAEDEAARLAMMAAWVVIVFVLAGLGRLLEPAVALTPNALCETGASWRDGRVQCDEAGAPIAPAAQLLIGRALDLNRADAASLQLVEGVGPKLSARIVRDRADRGPFRSVADVERVSGVGPKLRARIGRLATAR